MGVVVGTAMLPNSRLYRAAIHTCISVADALPHIPITLSEQPKNFTAVFRSPHSGDCKAVICKES